jgi:hypothetical protein
VPAYHFSAAEKCKPRIYRNTILNVILFDCVTWSLTREEHSLGVFENRALMRIFVAKKHEETGWWRKLHKEYRHDLYSSPSKTRIIKSKRMRWAMHVA